MKNWIATCVFFASLTVTAQTTYLHCGKLFESKTGEIKTQQTIIVEGERIKAVKPGYLNPEGGKLID